MKKLAVIPLLLLTFQAVKAQNCYAAFNFIQNGSTVSFNNQSAPIDSFTTFVWTFGDGDTAFSFNPTHTYNSTGMHLVCLQMETASGCTAIYCDSVFTDTSNTSNCLAAFTYTQDGLSFQFNNDSYASGQATYLWNFGDGNSSDTYSPNYIYSQAGYYLVCLTVNTDNGCTNTYCQYIQVTDTNCMVTMNYYAMGNDIQFYAGNANNGNGTYLWDFGDGTTADEMNPFHTYANPGFYFVCVQYTDSNCTAIDCDSFYVNNGDSCSADFFTWQSNGTVQFSPFFYDPVNAYLWNFGDGTWSNNAYSSHVYDQEGVYEVCLTVTGGGCTGTSCQSIYYMNDTMNNNSGICNADFQISAVDSSYSTIWITDLSTGANTYLWDFGDGTTSSVQYPSHTYSEDGLYEVCLTILCDSNQVSFHCEWIGIMDSLVSGDDSEIRSGFTLNVIPEVVSSIVPVAPAVTFSVYPNPTSGIIQFQLPASAPGEGLLQIRNMVGQVVKAHTIRLNGNETIQADLQDLQDGMYLIQLLVNEQAFTSLVMRQ